jgi:hypothetical protein
MSSIKEAIISLLETLPAEASLDEILAAIANQEVDPILREKIDAAEESIMALPADFDGEGSIAYDTATLNRVRSFLENLASLLLHRYQSVLVIPDILPGPEGSVDLHWENENFELLINIPADSSTPATYYGDDFGNNTSEGTFEVDQVDQGFLAWLKKK